MANVLNLRSYSVGELRDLLKYRSREAMGKNWSSAFDGEVLPDDHITVEPDQVLLFVQKIAIPQRGRPGTITGAAQQLIKTWHQAEKKESVLIEVENNSKPGIELLQNVLDHVDDFNKQFGTDEKIETVTEPTIEQPVKDQSVKKTFFERIAELSLLDWVYLVTVGLADYGLVLLLKEVGLAAAIVYTLISFHAMKMANSRTSQVTAGRGVTAVWLLEILAFFVHLTLFNRRLWSAIDELPFQVTDIETEGRPYYIALILATLFSAAGIYAVSTTLALLKEKIDAEEYETNYGKKY